MMQESLLLFIHQRAKISMLEDGQIILWKTRQLGNLTTAWMDARFDEKLNVKLKW